MTKERLAWHPAFASSVQLDLLRFGGMLEYETEHELNRQPLRIDLVVVRKDPALSIERGYASAFRGHNLLEYKSEQDSLTMDDLFKTVAYGCLYKAYGTCAGPVRHDDVTLTLVRRTRPSGLLADLESAGFPIEGPEPGIYDVRGLQFPTRVVVTSAIDPADGLWLASLGSEVPDGQLRDLVQAAGALEEPSARLLSDAALEVILRANGDAIVRLKEEDEKMYLTLRQNMQKEIDEAAATYMQQGLERGLERGLEQGLERGRTAQAVKSAENLLRLGALTNEQIASAVGLSLAEVERIADSLHPTAA